VFTEHNFAKSLLCWQNSWGSSLSQMRQMWRYTLPLIWIVAINLNCYLVRERQLFKKLKEFVNDSSELLTKYNLDDSPLRVTFESPKFCEHTLFIEIHFDNSVNFSLRMFSWTDTCHSEFPGHHLKALPIMVTVSFLIQGSRIAIFLSIIQFL
jgi:hypothetical protein